MMEILVRKVEVRDLDKLREFEQGVIETERPFDPTLKREETRYYDMASMIETPHIRVVVAEIDGEIVASGYARIEESKPYLTHDRHSYMGFMYTAPEHRGKGVNKKIIDALERWSLDQGVTEMRLEVYAENAPAIRAYEKIGYSTSILKMRKSLGS